MDELTFFRQFHAITEQDYALLVSHMQPRFARKGEVLIMPGQVQKELYLVKSGVQMSYFLSGHKQHTVAFTYPPNFCAIPESFSFQTPSRYYLTCLIDSELHGLTYGALQILFDQSPALERLFRRMTEAVLAGVINRHAELHSLTIEERFRAFCNRSPHLLQMVPHKHIASYLGIDATNFSKLYNTVKI